MAKLLNKLSLERRHHPVKPGTVFNEDLDRCGTQAHTAPQLLRWNAILTAIGP
jgi:hypothetical protein